MSLDYDAIHKQAATAIAESLARFKLRHWGFVMIRCTYASQAKWDKFMALAKQYTYGYFEERGMSEVYERLLWTVIEDPATLDGASLLEASRRFSEYDWVEVDPQGRKEGWDEEMGTWLNFPRYLFYLYVDDESLESVVDEERAELGDADCLKAVWADSVISREVDRLADLEAGEEEEEYEGYESKDEERMMLDLRKKVRISELADLYAALLRPDSWYYIGTDDDGVCLI
ncbi:hypothetical protein B0T22DRAFT_294684 [Podospora appendiculata]|uniref:Uncharacterized protein n=1 Tax=Podospora appendiculata TaxID=314037 RepID=A0AAE0X1P8_9PEZI|nr:hypothetical protein B0T22DRAFT_294684 [Podospora appendiculata]